MKISDLRAGVKINKLTVISERFKKEGLRTSHVICRCECGIEKVFRCTQLTKEKPIQSCGCYTNSSVYRMKALPTERTWGKLTITKDLGMIGGVRKVVATCSCGTPDGEYGLRDLLTGHTKSCGCFKIEKLKASSTHGLSHTRMYRIWQGIKGRCKNPNDDSYQLYGGRGILLDDCWENFEGFVEDMGESYTDEAEIDRIDVDGNYCKENCRWTDRSTNIHNKRKLAGCLSVFIGVTVTTRSKPFLMQIRRNGKNFCKAYSTEIEAAEAYDDVSYLIYGDRPNKKLIEEYYKEGKINSG